MSFLMQGLKRGFLYPLFVSAAFANSSFAEALSINGLSQTKDLKSAASMIVDLHGVLLMDVSDSVKETEIARAMEGVKDYFTSDQALADYRYGATKALTMVYFAGSNYTSETLLVSSEEEAKELQNSFLARVPNPDFSSWAFLSNDEILDGGTNVDGTLKDVLKIFKADKASGIQPLRRVVVLVGDDVPKLQIESASKASLDLTQQFQARICAIATNDPGTPVPAYDRVVTRGGINVKFNDPYAVMPPPCDVTYAKEPKDVRTGVAMALGMPKT